MKQIFKKSLLIFSVIIFLTTSNFVYANSALPSKEPINEIPVLWGGESRDPWELRAKIEVVQSGIYKITYEDLITIGFSPESINPNFLQMENQGRPVSYLFEGDSDQIFEAGESLLFYGGALSGEYLSSLYKHQSDHWPLIDGWQPEFSSHMIEKYTDTNVYWLYLSDEPGLRIGDRDGSPGDEQIVTSFRNLMMVDDENVWWTTHFTSEDTWFLGYYKISTFPYSHQYNLTLVDPVVDVDHTAIVSGQIISATSNTATSPDHHVQFFLNGQLISDDYWDGAISYEFSGEINQQYLVDGENEFSFTVLSQGLPVTAYAINHFSIDFQRKLSVKNGKLLFDHNPSGQATFNITGLGTESYDLWDISDPLNPIQVINTEYSDQQLSFADNSSSLRKYILMDSESLYSAADNLSLYQPVDLLSLNQQADYFIISPSLFMQTIQPLADYRESQGYKVRIIDIEDIYNQFNFGISHPIAIKNFFGYAYQHWQKPTPQYVLLVGDGHWDLKNLRSQHEIQNPPNFVWVDPVQGEVDSLSDLVAVAGDDIFPDAMIGRLPVNNNEELAIIIQKIIQFENASGDWLKNLTFVADNYYLQNPETYPACIDDNPITICPTDTAGNFPALVNNLISEVFDKPYQISKIFLDDYDCRSISSENCEEVTHLILNSFQQGNQFITYSGHGAIPFWSAEKVFHVDDIPALSNQEKSPIVFSLDCVDGYWYFPPDLSGETDRRSLSEELIRANGMGAVAVYASPGNGYLNGHELLQSGFFSTFNSDPNPTLGKLDINAKLNLMNSNGNGSLIYSYMIFGDPALRLHPINAAIYLPLVTK